MGHHYQDLQVWQKSIDFVEHIYLALKDFPKTEQFWLIDQIKRAAISIPSNIAEWYARWTTKNCLQFLYIARWSVAEIHTQLIIASRLKFLDDDTFCSLESQNNEISKMLAWLIKTLSQRLD